MSRPKNKLELFKSSQENYDKLISLIDSYNEKLLDKEFPVGLLNRNIRDVISHVHHWSTMTLSWYNEGQKGNKLDMPAAGHTWKSLPDLNREINEKYINTSLIEYRELFANSFSDLCRVISNHSDEELFEKKRYSCTGFTSMGSYMISAASSHYEWAYKLIRKSMK